MASRKTVSDEEAKLFRDAIGDVRRLEDDRSEHTPVRPSARPRQQELDDQAVLSELLSDPSESEILETGEHLGYRKNGVQNTVLRKLRKGGFSVQAELDLHGFTVEQARAEVSEFLARARAESIRCVRIIHGKGRKQAERGPRIKPFLNHWLQRKSDVMAFCSARPEDGGTGAVYVLLGKHKSD